MYRVPVINFIDKIDKSVRIKVIREGTREVLDSDLRGGDNREYKLTNLDGWYVASTTIYSAWELTIYAYQYK